MKRFFIKLLITVFAWAAVLYPLWVRLHSMTFTTDPGNYFPLFGLAAAALLWLHVISGVFEDWLRKYFDFDQYVRFTSLLILLCVILHPLLLILSPSISFMNLLRGDDVWYGIIGWLLLITYDISKSLKKHDFFSRNWNKILLISNIGFLLTFIHSLNLGSDLQLPPLREIWIFYGVTATLAVIYTYGIKRLALK
jgi:hypothetical protein